MKTLLRYGASIVLAISAVVLLFLTTVSAASDKLEPYFPVFFVFNIFVVLVLVSIVLSLVSKLITRYRQKKIWLAHARTASGHIVRYNIFACTFNLFFI